MLESLKRNAAKARDWMRERKAKRRQPMPHGASPALWVWFLAAIATTTLLGSSWMLLIFVAGSVGHVDWNFDWRAGNDGQPPHWIWTAEAQIHALIATGLFLACVGVAMFNAVWLHVRGHLHGTFKAVLTGIGVAVALFMISGAIVVQQWGTDARTRDEVTAANTAVAGVAAVDAEIAAINQRWSILCAPTLSTWQAQACRSGAQGWQDRISIARGQYRPGDPTLAIIERAIADAREGDRMQARLAQLRQQRAAAAVTTVQAQAEQVRADGWFAQVSHFLEDARKPFVAVLGELLAMTMFGVALAAHRTRQTSIEQSGWADEAHRIEDHSDEPELPLQPGMPLRTKVYDADSGEEMVQVKPHWRKLKKGKKHVVQVQPEIPPDESGAAPELDGGDGGLRSAGAPPSKEAAPEIAGDKESEGTDHSEQIGVIDAHPEPSEPTEEEAAALLAAADIITPQEPQQLADIAQQGGVDDEHGDDEQADELQGEHSDAPVAAEEHDNADDEDSRDDDEPEHYGPPVPERMRIAARAYEAAE